MIIEKKNWHSGPQENQQVVFMSDGGENVRRVQEYLHPFSEHLIDWFHITMRLTVLQQQTKALQEEWPETGAEVSKRLESVKDLLWHGNTEEVLERLGDLLTELGLITLDVQGSEHTPLSNTYNPTSGNPGGK